MRDLPSSPEAPGTNARSSPHTREWREVTGNFRFRGPLVHTTSRSPPQAARAVRAGVTSNLEISIYQSPPRCLASVGTTWLASSDGVGRPARPPRVRGRQATASGVRIGRSPRVRGRPSPRRRRRLPRRKIAARAGTTRCWTAGASRPREDPRACGDDPEQPRVAVRTQGRSPRMRGRPTMSPGTPSSIWKIPAHAGTTLAELGFYRRGRANSISPS